MIIITNPDITQDQLDHIREQVEARGMKTKITRGERQTIIGCIGDDDVLREMALHRLPGVQDVVRDDRRRATGRPEADHVAFCRDFLKIFGCTHFKINMGRRPENGTTAEDIKAIAETVTEIEARLQATESCAAVLPP